MASYRLSEKADEDLSRLYEYSIPHYGQERADRYYNGLIEQFEELVENPRLWQANDHIRLGYRRSVYGRHSIYYRIVPDTIVIMHILGRQNLQQLQSSDKPNLVEVACKAGAAPHAEPRECGISKGLGVAHLGQHDKLLEGLGGRIVEPPGGLDVVAGNVFRVFIEIAVSSLADDGALLTRH